MGLKGFFVVMTFLAMGWEGQASSPDSITNDVGLINHNNKQLALGGYDVVAYFQNHERGVKNKGKKGSQAFSVNHKGVTYHFSSQENQDLFVTNPEKYLPAYGGWCAWAMSYGETRVSVNLDTFLIAPDANGKETLYLFYNRWTTNTLKKWLAKDHTTLVQKSDVTWNTELKNFKKK